ncbi:glycosyltransferase [Alicyclobacillaceae bacterium I2511]|nr:glycosyltransferase [Alicyclobacillaceae bacterium I2511]
MTKILFVVHRMGLGGTETHLLALADAFIRRGHPVGVFCAGGPFLSEFQRRRVTLHISPPFEQPNQAALRSLRQLVDNQQYQVVHGHDSAAFRLLARANLPRWVRLGVTVHGTYANASALRQVSKVAHWLIAVSPQVRLYLLHQGIPAQKVHLIGNGVPMQVYHPGMDHTFRPRWNLPKDGFVVGYAGRFTLAKAKVGQRVVETLTRHARELPNLYILVAGPGSRQHLRPGAAANLRLCGALFPMAAYYRACDLVIGTGRVAIEAMASGKPVLALGESRYHGLLTVQNFAAARFTNFGDHGPPQSWSALALWQDVRRVYNQPAEAKRQAGRLHTLVLKDFSVYHSVDQLLHLLKENPI